MVKLSSELTVFHSRLFSYNAGAFMSGGEAVLVDPGLFPNEIAAMKEHLAGAPVKAIVLTHSHWDHVLGPEHFPGVPVVQQRESLAVLPEHGPGIEAQVGEWWEQNGLERRQPFALPDPTETFDGEMTLRVGNAELTLLSAPGHAEEHLVAHHAENGLLWAGDMLSDIEIPYVMQSLRAYRCTLEGIAVMDVAALVPGHGSATRDAEEIRKRMDEDRHYLTELDRKVTEAVAAGKAADEAVAACSGMRFRHRDTNLQSHRLNVETAFVELGGEPDPRHPGWNRLQ